jgi:hypothetical protein
VPETVLIIVFMEGFKVCPARTQLFRTRVSTFDEAVRVALEEDYCHKQSRISASLASVMTTTEGPQPMELGSAEQRNTQVTGYACGRVGHMQRNYRRATVTPKGVLTIALSAAPTLVALATPRPDRSTVAVAGRETRAPSRRGAPY